MKHCTRANHTLHIPCELLYIELKTEKRRLYKRVAIRSTATVPRQRRTAELLPGQNERLRYSPRSARGGFWRHRVGRTVLASAGAHVEIGCLESQDNTRYTSVQSEVATG